MIPILNDVLGFYLVYKGSLSPAEDGPDQHLKMGPICDLFLNGAHPRGLPFDL